MSNGEPAPTGPLPDAVLGTANILNGTYEPGFHPAPHGIGPDSTVYDPVSGLVYVADASSNEVTVLNPALDRMVAVIPVGSDPVDLIFDPAGAEIVVSNWNSGNLSIINASTNRVEATVQIGPTHGWLKTGPYELAYDNATGTVFVGRLGYWLIPCTEFNVTELNGRTNQIVGTIYLPGCSPWSVTYDSATGGLYVSYVLSDQVDEVDVATGAVAGGIQLPYNVVDVTLDSSQGLLAVAAWQYPALHVNLYLYATSNLSVEHNFSIPTGGSAAGPGSPLGLVYDSDFDSLILAAAYRVYSVSPNNGTAAPVISDTTPESIWTSCFGGLSYSTIYDHILASDLCENRVLSIWASNASFEGGETVGVSPWGLESDPDAGRIYVADGDGVGLTVLNGSTLEPEMAIPVGPDPRALAYDPSLRTTFVLSWTSGTLQPVPDSGSAAGAALSLIGANAANYDETTVNGLNYSSSTGELYVVQVTSPTYVYSCENLTVVNPQTNSVVRNLTVSQFAGSLSTNPNVPAGVLSLPGTTEAVVSDPWEGLVFGLDLLNGDRLWRTSVGGNPTALLFNPRTGGIDVTDPQENKTFELSPSNGSVLRTVVLDGSPTGLAYDPLNDRLYVTEDQQSVSGAVGVVQEFNATSWEPFTNVSISTTLGPGVEFLSQTGTVAATVSAASSVIFLGQALAAGLNVSSASLVQAEPFTLQVIANDGAPPYTWNLSGLPSGCRSLSVQPLPRYSCDPGTAGIYPVRLSVGDAANETYHATDRLVVQPYPLVVGISRLPPASDLNFTVNSQADFEVNWSMAEGALVGPWTSFHWSWTPQGNASANSTSAFDVRLTFLSVGPIVLILTASFNGTNASWSILLSVRSGTSPGWGPGDWIEVGLLALIAASAAAIVMAVRIRRRKQRGGP